MENYRNDAYSSILDKDIQELVSMDINELRKVFLDEIKYLNNLDEKERNKRLGHIFKRLFSFQPSDKNNYNFKRSEQRLYVDLISTSGLKDISYVRDFLKNSQIFKDISSDSKRRLLIQIFEYYDIHSKEEINKFNYVFRSSSNISYFFLNSSLIVNKIFSSRIMNIFDKESLGELYRDYFDSEFMLSQLLKFIDIDNHKALYMIGLMDKKIKMSIGHDLDFLDRVKVLLIYSGLRNDVKTLLDSFYDNYVGCLENEDIFFKQYMSNGCLEIDELINYIMLGDNTSFFRGYNSFDKVNDFVLAKRNKHFSCLLDDIKNDEDLINFKDAIFYNLYGVSLDRAIVLDSIYGKDIDNLDKDILSNDKSILMILKSIKEIINLDINDGEKICVLQLMYQKKIVENKDNFRNRYFSSFILEGLFNRMFINTYNKKLLNVNSLNMLKEVDGVKVFDSGFDFMIMLTSLHGISDFYDENVNMASKWNTAYLSETNGLCCSHIENSNLGVISLDSVILGFDHIPQYSLNKMGASDIFSNPVSGNMRGDIGF